MGKFHRQGFLTRSAAGVLLLLAAVLLLSIPGVTSESAGRLAAAPLSSSHFVAGGEFLYSDWRRTAGDSPTAGLSREGDFLREGDWRRRWARDVAADGREVLRRTRDTLSLNQMFLQAINGEEADLQAWRRTQSELARRTLVDGTTDRLLGALSAQAREWSFIRTLEVDFRSALGDRPWSFGLNALGPLRESEQDAVAWQLRAYTGEDERRGVNAGLLYRRAALDGAALWGVNTFLDYEDTDRYGDFYRWSLGGEVRSGWVDVYGNLYWAITDAQKTRTTDNRQYWAYTRDGYDVEVHVHAPGRNRWLTGVLGYYLWEADGRFRNANGTPHTDQEGLKYGLILGPLGGDSVLAGLRLEVEFDSPERESDEFGGRLSYTVDFGGRPAGNGEIKAFDARDYFFAPVRREHTQRISEGFAGALSDARIRFVRGEAAVRGTGGFLVVLNGNTQGVFSYTERLTTGGLTTTVAAAADRPYGLFFRRQTITVETDAAANSELRVNGNGNVWQLTLLADTEAVFLQQGAVLSLTRGEARLQRNGGIERLDTPQVQVTLLGTRLAVSHDARTAITLSEGRIRYDFVDGDGDGDIEATELSVLVRPAGENTVAEAVIDHPTGPDVVVGCDSLANRFPQDDRVGAHTDCRDAMAATAELGLDASSAVMLADGGERVVLQRAASGQITETKQVGGVDIEVSWGDEYLISRDNIMVSVMSGGASLDLGSGPAITFSAGDAAMVTPSGVVGVSGGGATIDSISYGCGVGETQGRNDATGFFTTCPLTGNFDDSLDIRVSVVLMEEIVIGGGTAGGEAGYRFQFVGGGGIENVGRFLANGRRLQSGGEFFGTLTVTVPDVYEARPEEDYGVLGTILLRISDNGDNAANVAAQTLTLAVSLSERISFNPTGVTRFIPIGFNAPLYTVQALGGEPNDDGHYVYWYEGTDDEINDGGRRAVGSGLTAESLVVSVAAAGSFSSPLIATARIRAQDFTAEADGGPQMTEEGFSLTIRSVAPLALESGDSEQFIRVRTGATEGAQAIFEFGGGTEYRYQIVSAASGVGIGQYRINNLPEPVRLGGTENFDGTGLTLALTTPYTRTVENLTPLGAIVLEITDRESGVRDLFSPIRVTVRVTLVPPFSFAGDNPREVTEVENISGTATRAAIDAAAVNGLNVFLTPAAGFSTQGEEGAVSYALASGGIHAALLIENARLKVGGSGLTDPRNRALYTIFVTATDSDSPPSTAILTVVLRLNDDLDYSPNVTEGTFRQATDSNNILRLFSNNAQGGVSYTIVSVFGVANTPPTSSALLRRAAAAFPIAASTESDSASDESDAVDLISYMDFVSARFQSFDPGFVAATGATYTLAIRATDGGGRTDTKAFTAIFPPPLELVGANRRTVTVATAKGDITDNTRLSSLDIAVTNPDGAVTYSVLSVQAARPTGSFVNAFAINSSGEVVVNANIDDRASFDNDLRSRYEVMFTAVDASEAQAELRAVVVFPQPPLNISTPRDSAGRTWDGESRRQPGGESLDTFTAAADDSVLRLVSENAAGAITYAIESIEGAGIAEPTNAATRAAALRVFPITRSNLADDAGAEDLVSFMGFDASEYAAFDDGSYGDVFTLSVSATDEIGRTATVDLTVQFDARPPLAFSAATRAAGNTQQTGLSTADDISPLATLEAENVAAGVTFILSGITPLDDKLTEARLAFPITQAGGAMGATVGFDADAYDDFEDFGTPEEYVLEVQAEDRRGGEGGLAILTLTVEFATPPLTFVGGNPAVASAGAGVNDAGIYTVRPTGGRPNHRRPAGDYTFSFEEFIPPLANPYFDRPDGESGVIGDIFSVDWLGVGVAAGTVTVVIKAEDAAMTEALLTLEVRAFDELTFSPSLATVTVTVGGTGVFYTATPRGAGRPYRVIYRDLPGSSALWFDQSVNGNEVLEVREGSQLGAPDPAVRQTVTVEIQATNTPAERQEEQTATLTLVVVSRPAPLPLAFAGANPRELTEIFEDGRGDGETATRTVIDRIVGVSGDAFWTPLNALSTENAEGAVTYTLASGGIHGVLDIASDAIQVRSGGLSDTRQRALYTIFVIAADSRTPPSRATLTAVLRLGDDLDYQPNRTEWADGDPDENADNILRLQTNNAQGAVSYAIVSVFGVGNNPTDGGLLTRAAAAFPIAATTESDSASDESDAVDLISYMDFVAAEIRDFDPAFVAAVGAEYTLAIRATDSGVGRTDTEAFAVIFPTPPLVFSADVPRRVENVARVNAAAAEGTALLTLSVDDGVGDVTYSLDSAAGLAPIEAALLPRFFPFAGNYLGADNNVFSSINPDADNAFSIVFTATDSFDPPKTATVTVTLQLIAVARQTLPLAFTDNPFTVTDVFGDVSGPPTRVKFDSISFSNVNDIYLTPAAGFSPENAEGVVTYTLPSGGIHDSLEIEINRLRVRDSGLTDPRQRALYTISVLAADSRTPPSTATLSVVLRLGDDLDYQPGVTEWTAAASNEDADDILRLFSNNAQGAVAYSITRVEGVGNDPTDADLLTRAAAAFPITPTAVPNEADAVDLIFYMGFVAAEFKNLVPAFNPALAARYTLAIRAEDSNGRTDTELLTVIFPAPPPLAIKDGFGANGAVPINSDGLLVLNFGNSDRGGESSANRIQIRPQNAFGAVRYELVGVTPVTRIQGTRIPGFVIINTEETNRFGAILGPGTIRPQFDRALVEFRFDSDVRTRYTLLVQVTDERGGPTGTATATVQVNTQEALRFENSGGSERTILPGQDLANPFVLYSSRAQGAVSYSITRVEGVGDGTGTDAPTHADLLARAAAAFPIAPRESDTPDLISIMDFARAEFGNFDPGFVPAAGGKYTLLVRARDAGTHPNAGARTATRQYEVTFPPPPPPPLRFEPALDTVEVTVGAGQTMFYEAQALGGVPASFSFQGRDTPRYDYEYAVVNPESARTKFVESNIGRVAAVDRLRMFHGPQAFTEAGTVTVFISAEDEATPPVRATLSLIVRAVLPFGFSADVPRRVVVAHEIAAAAEGTAALTLSVDSGVGDVTYSVVSAQGAGPLSDALRANAFPIVENYLGIGSPIATGFSRPSNDDNYVVVLEATDSDTPPQTARVEVIFQLAPPLAILSQLPLVEIPLNLDGDDIDHDVDEDLGARIGGGLARTFVAVVLSTPGEVFSDADAGTGPGQVAVIIAPDSRGNEIDLLISFGNAYLDPYSAVTEYTVITATIRVTDSSDSGLDSVDFVLTVQFGDPPAIAIENAVNAEGLLVLNFGADRGDSDSSNRLQIRTQNEIGDVVYELLGVTPVTRILGTRIAGFEITDGGEIRASHSGALAETAFDRDLRGRYTLVVKATDSRTGAAGTATATVQVNTQDDLSFENNEGRERTIPFGGDLASPFVLYSTGARGAVSYSITRVEGVGDGTGNDEPDAPDLLTRAAAAFPIAPRESDTPDLVSHMTFAADALPAFDPAFVPTTGGVYTLFVTAEDDGRTDTEEYRVTLEAAPLAFAFAGANPRELTEVFGDISGTATRAAINFTAVDDGGDAFLTPAGGLSTENGEGAVTYALSSAGGIIHNALLVNDSNRLLVGGSGLVDSRQRALYTIFVTATDSAAPTANKATLTAVLRLGDALTYVPNRTEWTDGAPDADADNILRLQTNNAQGGVSYRISRVLGVGDGTGNDAPTSADLLARAAAAFPIAATTPGDSPSDESDAVDLISYMDFDADSYGAFDPAGGINYTLAIEITDGAGRTATAEFAVRFPAPPAVFGFAGDNPFTVAEVFGDISGAPTRAAINASAVDDGGEVFLTPVWTTENAEGAVSYSLSSAGGIHFALEIENTRLLVGGEGLADIYLRALYTIFVTATDSASPEANKATLTVVLRLGDDLDYQPNRTGWTTGAPDADSDNILRLQTNHAQGAVSYAIVSVFGVGDNPTEPSLLTRAAAAFPIAATEVSGELVAADLISYMDFVSAAYAAFDPAGGINYTLAIEATDGAGRKDTEEFLVSFPPPPLPPLSLLKPIPEVSFPPSVSRKVEIELSEHIGGGGDNPDLQAVVHTAPSTFARRDSVTTDALGSSRLFILEVDTNDNPNKIVLSFCVSGITCLNTPREASGIGEVVIRVSNAAPGATGEPVDLQLTVQIEEPPPLAILSRLPVVEIPLNYDGIGEGFNVEEDLGERIGGGLDRTFLAQVLSTPGEVYSGDDRGPGMVAVIVTPNFESNELNLLLGFSDADLDPYSPVSEYTVITATIRVTDSSASALGSVDFVLTVQFGEPPPFAFAGANPRELTEVFGDISGAPTRAAIDAAAADSLDAFLTPAGGLSTENGEGAVTYALSSAGGIIHNALSVNSSNRLLVGGSGLSDTRQRALYTIFVTATDSATPTANKATLTAVLRLGDALTYAPNRTEWTDGSPDADADNILRLFANNAQGAVSYRISRVLGVGDNPTEPGLLTRAAAAFPIAASTVPNESDAVDLIAYMDFDASAYAAFDPAGGINYTLGIEITDGGGRTATAEFAVRFPAPPLAISTPLPVVRCVTSTVCEMTLNLDDYISGGGDNRDLLAIIQSATGSAFRRDSRGDNAAGGWLLSVDNARDGNFADKIFVGIGLTGLARHISNATYNAVIRVSNQAPGATAETVDLLLTVQIRRPLAVGNTANAEGLIELNFGAARANGNVSNRLQIQTQNAVGEVSYELLEVTPRTRINVAESARRAGFEITGDGLIRARSDIDRFEFDQDVRNRYTLAVKVTDERAGSAGTATVSVQVNLLDPLQFRGSNSGGNDRGRTIPSGADVADIFTLYYWHARGAMSYRFTRVNGVGDGTGNDAPTADDLLTRAAAAFPIAPSTRPGDDGGPEDDGAQDIISYMSFTAAQLQTFDPAFVPTTGGKYTLFVTAADDDRRTDVQEYEVTFEPAAPVFSFVNTRQGREINRGASFAADADSALFDLSLENAPAGTPAYTFISANPVPISGDYGSAISSVIRDGGPFHDAFATRGGFSFAENFMGFTWATFARHYGEGGATLPNRVEIVVQAESGGDTARATLTVNFLDFAPFAISVPQDEYADLDKSTVYNAADPLFQVSFSGGDGTQSNLELVEVLPRTSDTLSKGGGTAWDFRQPCNCFWYRQQFLEEDRNGVMHDIYRRSRYEAVLAATGNGMRVTATVTLQFSTPAPSLSLPETAPQVRNVAREDGDVYTLTVHHSAGEVSWAVDSAMKGDGGVFAPVLGDELTRVQNAFVLANDGLSLLATLRVAGAAASGSLLDGAAYQLQIVATDGGRATQNTAEGRVEVYLAAAPAGLELAGPTPLPPLLPVNVAILDTPVLTLSVADLIVGGGNYRVQVPSPNRQWPVAVNADNTTVTVQVNLTQPRPTEEVIVLRVSNADNSLVPGVDVLLTLQWAYPLIFGGEKAFSVNYPLGYDTGVQPAEKLDLASRLNRGEADSLIQDQGLFRRFALDITSADGAVLAAGDADDGRGVVRLLLDPNDESNAEMIEVSTEGLPSVDSFRVLTATVQVRDTSIIASDAGAERFCAGAQEPACRAIYAGRAAGVPEFEVKVQFGEPPTRLRFAALEEYRGEKSAAKAGDSGGHLFHIRPSNALGEVTYRLLGVAPANLGGLGVTPNNINAPRAVFPLRQDGTEAFIGYAPPPRFVDFDPLERNKYILTLEATDSGRTGAVLGPLASNTLTVTAVLIGPFAVSQDTPREFFNVPRGSERVLTQLRFIDHPSPLRLDQLKVTGLPANVFERPPLSALQAREDYFPRANRSGIIPGSLPREAAANSLFNTAERAGSSGSFNKGIPEIQQFGVIPLAYATYDIVWNPSADANNDGVGEFFAGVFSNAATLERLTVVSTYTGRTPGASQGGQAAALTVVLNFAASGFSLADSQEFLFDSLDKRATRDFALNLASGVGVFTLLEIQPRTGEFDGLFSIFVDSDSNSFLRYNPVDNAENLAYRDFDAQDRSQYFADVQVVSGGETARYRFTLRFSPSAAFAVDATTPSQVRRRIDALGGDFLTLAVLNEAAGATAYSFVEAVPPLPGNAGVTFSGNKASFTNSGDLAVGRHVLHFSAQNRLDTVTHMVTFDIVTDQFAFFDAPPMLDNIGRGRDSDALLLLTVVNQTGAVEFALASAVPANVASGGDAAALAQLAFPVVRRDDDSAFLGFSASDFRRFDTVGGRDVYTLSLTARDTTANKTVTLSLLLNLSPLQPLAFSSETVVQLGPRGDDSRSLLAVDNAAGAVTYRLLSVDIDGLDIAAEPLAFNLESRPGDDTANILRYVAANLDSFDPEHGEIPRNAYTFAIEAADEGRLASADGRLATLQLRVVFDSLPFGLTPASRRKLQAPFAVNNAQAKTFVTLRFVGFDESIKGTNNPNGRIDLQSTSAFPDDPGHNFHRFGCNTANLDLLVLGTNRCGNLAIGFIRGTGSAPSAGVRELEVLFNANSAGLAGNGFSREIPRWEGVYDFIVGSTFAQSGAMEQIARFAVTLDIEYARDFRLDSFNPGNGDVEIAKDAVFTAVEGNALATLRVDAASHSGTRLSVRAVRNDLFPIAIDADNIRVYVGYNGASSEAAALGSGSVARITVFSLDDNNAVLDMFDTTIQLRFPVLIAGELLNVFGGFFSEERPPVAGTAWYRIVVSGVQPAEAGDIMLEHIEKPGRGSFSGIPPPPADGIPIRQDADNPLVFYVGYARCGFSAEQRALNGGIYSFGSIIRVTFGTTVRNLEPLVIIQHPSTPPCESLSPLSAPPRAASEFDALQVETGARESFLLNGGSGQYRVEWLSADARLKANDKFLVNGDAALTVGEGFDADAAARDDGTTAATFSVELVNFYSALDLEMVDEDGSLGEMVFRVSDRTAELTPLLLTLELIFSAPSPPKFSFSLDAAVTGLDKRTDRPGKNPLAKFVAANIPAGTRVSYTVADIQPRTAAADYAIANIFKLKVGGDDTSLLFRTGRYRDNADLFDAYRRNQYEIVVDAAAAVEPPLTARATLTVQFSEPGPALAISRTAVYGAGEKTALHRLTMYHALGEASFAVAAVEDAATGESLSTGEAFSFVRSPEKLRARLLFDAAAFAAAAPDVDHARLFLTATDSAGEGRTTQRVAAEIIIPPFDFSAEMPRLVVAGRNVNPLLQESVLTLSAGAANRAVQYTVESFLPLGENAHLANSVFSIFNDQLVLSFRDFQNYYGAAASQISTVSVALSAEDREAGARALLTVAVVVPPPLSLSTPPLLTVPTGETRLPVAGDALHTLTVHHAQGDLDFAFARRTDSPLSRPGPFAPGLNFAFSAAADSSNGKIYLGFDAEKFAADSRQSTDPDGLVLSTAEKAGGEFINWRIPVLLEISVQFSGAIPPPPPPPPPSGDFSPITFDAPAVVLDGSMLNRQAVAGDALLTIRLGGLSGVNVLLQIGLLPDSPYLVELLPPPPGVIPPPPAVPKGQDFRANPNFAITAVRDSADNSIVYLGFDRAKFDADNCATLRAPWVLEVRDTDAGGILLGGIPRVTGFLVGYTVARNLDIAQQQCFR